MLMADDKIVCPTNKGRCQSEPLVSDHKLAFSGADASDGRGFSFKMHQAVTARL
jgi:hypothetical protein